MVITQVVCHTELTRRNELHGVEVSFLEGVIYSAVAYSPDAIDVIEEEGKAYLSFNVDTFYKNFMTISCAKDEEEFYSLICSKPTIQELQNKFNELLILKKWQEKQRKQSK